MDTLIAPLQPVIAAPEQVPAIRPFNFDMKVPLTTEDTAGAMSIIVACHNPGEGPPDHVHFNQEEIFFIVDGLYELTIDGQTSIGGPGTLVFIPRNTVHSFKNVGATPACMLDWTLPGGQDRYFKKISELAAGGSFTGDKRSSTKSTTQPLFRTLTGSQILTPNQHVVATARTYEIANRPSGYRRWRGKALE